jgi:hypothetical protein
VRSTTRSADENENPLAQSLLCRSDDQRDLRRRKKAALRPVYIVAAVVIALGFALPCVRLPYGGPWSVWARPSGGRSPLTDLPDFGDVREGPAGDAAQGTWTAGAHRSVAGAWEAALVLRPVLLRTREFRPLPAERDVRDARWTAFVPDVRPGDLARSAPDWRCVGTWVLEEDTPEGAAQRPPRTVVLSSVGDVEGAGPGATWGVFGDALVIDRPDDPEGGVIDVGVLSDDRRDFVGRRKRSSSGDGHAVRGRRDDR